MKINSILHSFNNKSAKRTNMTSIYKNKSGTEIAPENSYPVFFNARLYKDGFLSVSKLYIKRLIDNYKGDNNAISLLGQGTFGTVYNIFFPGKGNIAVKILTPGKPVLYGGGNLKKEAEILESIPAVCSRTQQLVDYFKFEGREHLVSSVVQGKPLSKQKNVSPELLDDITEELFKYDVNGLMFYDFNPNNILVHNNKAGFIDFEFMEYKNIKQKNFDAFNDFHHLDRNLYHPVKSNINSFENRCLGLVFKMPEAEKNSIIKNYLKSLSGYYNKRADFYSSLKSSDGISNKAVKYEKVLAELFKNPVDEIVNIEKNFIDLRFTTLNYHLYMQRKKENKLIEGDIETYGDFNKYITRMKHLVKDIFIGLNKLSQQHGNKDIEKYCGVNRVFAENFLRKNANPVYFALRRDTDAEKLEILQNTVMSNYNKRKNYINIARFNKEYDRLMNKYQNSPNFLTLFKSIKITYEKNMNFIQNEIL